MEISNKGSMKKSVLKRERETPCHAHQSSTNDRVIRDRVELGLIILIIWRFFGANEFWFEG